jgi:hypothetical protein
MNIDSGLRRALRHTRKARRLAAYVIVLLASAVLVTALLGTWAVHEMRGGIRGTGISRAEVQEEVRKIAAHRFGERAAVTCRPTSVNVWMCAIVTIRGRHAHVRAEWQPKERSLGIGTLEPG